MKYTDCVRTFFRCLFFPAHSLALSGETIPSDSARKEAVSLISERTFSQFITLIAAAIRRTVAASAAMAMRMNFSLRLCIICGLSLLQ